MATLTHTNCCHCAPKPVRFSISEMISVHRQRRKLAHLSDSQLQDIGLTRTQAMTEARRPFWDI